MLFVTDSLYTLARTAMGIGLAFAGVNLAMIVLVLGVSSEGNPDNRKFVWLFCMWLAIFNCLPGLIEFVLGLQLLRGRLWAAVALVTVAMLDSAKYVVMVFMTTIQPDDLWAYRQYCDITLLVMSIVLLTRCSLAIPEIRRQMRMKRRSYYSEFGPAPANAYTKLQAPPKSLKESRGRYG